MFESKVNGVQIYKDGRLAASVVSTLNNESRLISIFATTLTEDEWIKFSYEIIKAFTSMSNDKPNSFKINSTADY